MAQPRCCSRPSSRLPCNAVHTSEPIINPDGTDRPVTKVIRTQGPRFLKAVKPAKPDYWIAVNRDHDARGLYGIYQAVQADFGKAIAEGRHPALKWESPPGAAK